MTTPRGSKIRMLLVVLFLILFAALIVSVTLQTKDVAVPEGLSEFVHPKIVSVTQRTKDVAVPKGLSEPVHPKSPPTDFYEKALIVDELYSRKVRFRPDQVSYESILYFLNLNEGDLLADYWLSSDREVLEEGQINEARAIARQYDLHLKDLRRERSQILEQAGVSIKDPLQRLKQFREKAFLLLTEVGRRISREVLTEKQRKMIVDKQQELRAAKEAAAAKHDTAAAEETPTN